MCVCVCVCVCKCVRQCLCMCVRVSSSFQQIGHKSEKLCSHIDGTSKQIYNEYNKNPSATLTLRVHPMNISALEILYECGHNKEDYAGQVRLELPHSPSGPPVISKTFISDAHSAQTHCLSSVCVNHLTSSLPPTGR